MNKADRYLIRHGFNLDGSKMKKKQALKQKKKNLKTEYLIADKRDFQRLKFKREAIEDRKK